MTTELPKWADNVLQGISYWLGYQSAFFRHYHVPENAIVHEACKLIAAHNESGQLIFREVAYSKLGVKLLKKTGEEHRAMADLVLAGAKIAESDDPDQESVSCVIEVKRYAVNPALINKDLQRLHDYLVQKTNNAARAFLLVFSERMLPERFVKVSNEPDEMLDIRGILGKIPVPERAGYFQVRRVCKAVHSFKKPATAHYACLIEVFALRDAK